MWQIWYGLARTYAPIIMWPFAAVIGFTGYQIERAIRGDATTPSADSTQVARLERKLNESQADPTEVTSLKQMKQTRTMFDTVPDNKVSESSLGFMSEDKKTA